MICLSQLTIQAGRDHPITHCTGTSRPSRQRPPVEARDHRETLRESNLRPNKICPAQIPLFDISNNHFTFYRLAEHVASRGDLLRQLQDQPDDPLAQDPDRRDRVQRLRPLPQTARGEFVAGDQFGFVGFSQVTGWTAGGARPGVINLGLRRSKSPLTMAPNPDGASGWSDGRTGKGEGRRRGGGCGGRYDRSSGLGDRDGRVLCGRQTFLLS